VLELGLASAAIAGCASHPVEPPAPPQTVSVSVHVSGWLGCNSYMFYGCRSVLTVRPADAPSTFRRPPSEDLSWRPDPNSGLKADERVLVGTVGPLTVGRHQLVVTLMGSEDVVSFAPDGSIGFDLLARCSLNANLPPGARSVDLLITFVADPTGASRQATCLMETTAS
jgi:hypothetical protein